MHPQILSASHHRNSTCMPSKKGGVQLAVSARPTHASEIVAPFLRYVYNLDNVLT